MPDHPCLGLKLMPLAICCVCAGPALAAGPDPLGDGELVIEMDGPETGGPDEILIEDGPYQAPASAEELIIDDDAVEDPGMATGVEAGIAEAEDTGSGRLDMRIDDVRAEYSHFTRSASEADHSLYGKVSALANWQPAPTWELQAAGRLDGHNQQGSLDYSSVKADYGDSYIRYRGERVRLTAGTQTVIWGRLDELPLADRVSTADLTRLILDDLEDRRRSNPMIRAETFFGAAKLDLVWLVDFRPAELPDKDSVWYPINRQTGRILGFDPKDVPPAAVRAATISEDAPGGDGGFGARYTRTHAIADFGVTVARTRQSIPYFRAAGPGAIKAEYPRSWSYGLDAAADAAGATWRFEVLYNSDNPVTRTDLTYTTTPAISWGGGIELHPGDGDTRVNVQVVGTNLVDAPSIIDRKEIYGLNGEIEVPFDRERWRTSLDFYVGLGDKDLYLNPEVAFLGWEPHELYLALHYFDGDTQTLGGFHKEHSSVNLGWRARF
jgi:hypothetical protein